MRRWRSVARPAEVEKVVADLHLFSAIRRIVSGDFQEAIVVDRHGDLDLPFGVVELESAAPDTFIRLLRLPFPYFENRAFRRAIGTLDNLRNWRILLQHEVDVLPSVANQLHAEAMGKDSRTRSR